MQHLLLTFILCLTLPSVVFAEEQADFTDLPKDHFAYEAVQFLRDNGVISGYEDNTFRPDNTVNRAEAIKIIVAPLITDDQLAQAKNATSSYDDIAEDAWYKPYTELARLAGIIDGPPDKTRFNGTDSVIKVEYLKMVQQAYGADPVSSFSEIVLPLSTDVADTTQWYYPYMRYGITSSMTMISSEGVLNPAKNLTRAETAVMLYRYIMYEQKRRTQALLSEAESEIQIVLSFLQQQNIPEAQYASARALLAARGAHAATPDQSIVQGAVKITESLRSVVRGYTAAMNQDFDEGLRLFGEAWNLAERAKEKESSLSTMADQIQQLAKSMADAVRTQTQGTEEE